ncbi:helix-turn-helix domain-containing protein [Nonomuraea longispora]|uniref:helix-turn-helix domain-containing protein n=1 Tax=Nonomuraea longispora TaxID=1848320 RepID=UPI001C700B9B|nr:helix-turn-helix domain-containing protein [Nonomuraea longispora]
MSVSAFYRNFHAVTAMSPIQFQKQIRLQEARLLLATHPNDVMGVCHRVGYGNPSQSRSSAANTAASSACRPARTPPGCVTRRVPLRLSSPEPPPSRHRHPRPQAAGENRPLEARS